MHLDDILRSKRLLWGPGREPKPSGPRHAPVEHGRFRAALQRADVAIIAEIKPRSPSKGDLLPASAAARQALDYQAGGAAAISVIADEPFFGGSPELVREIAAIVDVPVLYKDFVVDARQVALAHACGADAVLVIVRALTDVELTGILATARELGLDVLVETFTEQEVHRAVDAGATIIGVNNRDLDTFEVDLRNSARLRDLIPTGTVAVSESGLNSRQDVQAVAVDGFHAALVGEALLTSTNVRSALGTLTGVGVRPKVAS